MIGTYANRLMQEGGFDKVGRIVADRPAFGVRDRRGYCSAGAGDAVCRNHMGITSGLITITGSSRWYPHRMESDCSVSTFVELTRVLKHMANSGYESDDRP